jgi:hypothetical protein
LAPSTTILAFAKETQDAEAMVLTPVALKVKLE